MTAWKHGKAILDGNLRYLSASALQLAESCPRRHFYHYAKGLKDPPSKATERGAALHAEVEYFLKTSDRSRLSSDVLTGMPLFPDPGSDLFIEHDILIHPDDELVARDAEMEAVMAEQAGLLHRAHELRQQAAAIRDASLQDAIVRADGVPMVGKIDCMHDRGTNKGTSDITETIDPDGTVEVLDWKFVKNLRYAKSPQDLATTIQTASYAKFVFNAYDQAERVRLSLGYVPSSGNPRKVTALVTRDQIDETWNRVEALAGYLRDAAKADDPDSIEANTKSCNLYNRPCPASGTCRAAMTQSLASVVGVTSAENLLKKLRDRKKPADMTDTPKKTGFGSLGARLGGKPITTSTTPGSVNLSPEEVAKEKARLAREAVLAKHPGLDKLVADIVACGLGFPTMVNDAAEPVGIIRGKAAMGYKGKVYLEGEGELQQFEIPTVEELANVLADVQAEVASRTATPVADPDGNGIAPPMIVPPETPESTHTPSETLAEVAKTLTTAAEEIAAQASGEKPKKTRAPKKSKAVAETAEAVKDLQQASQVLTDELGRVPTAKELAESDGAAKLQQITQQVMKSVTAITLYVNCALLDGVQARDLYPIVSAIIDDLNAVAAPYPDFRFVPESHSLAYGKWRPAFAALLRESGIGPGPWFYNGVGGDIQQCVVETMRGICAASGGALILGAR